VSHILLGNICIIVPEKKILQALCITDQARKQLLEMSKPALAANPGSAAQTLKQRSCTLCSLS
jgi:hypothetical protein